MALNILRLSLAACIVALGWAVIAALLTADAAAEAARCRAVYELCAETTAGTDLALHECATSAYCESGL